MPKFRKARKPLLAEINVVPYIDVMLVLLVIFMITAPLLTQGVKVNLPRAQSKALSVKQQLPIIVSVKQNGQYFLNIAKQPQQAINAQQLQNQVATALATAQKQQQKRSIYIKGDAAVNYGQVVQAMVLLQQAGAKNIGLLTQPLAQKKDTL